MDKRFLQQGLDKKLAHFLEECGEAISAGAKCQRWGMDAVNPLLPPEEQETNKDWLLREINDVKATAELLLVELQKQPD